MTRETNTESGNVRFSNGLGHLTAADRDAIAAMPTGWFNVLELPYPGIKRAEYRCDRLNNMGILERRVTGVYPRLTTEFRLRSNASLSRDSAEGDGVGLKR